MWSGIGALTRQEGFMTRAELIARYEERSGRSMSALNWYQALALWKAAVFMEGNYKRFQAGNSDDQYLAAFDRGVPLLAEKAHEIARCVKGLLVDFGGVLTTNVFDSFRAFCEEEGLDPDAMKRLLPGGAARGRGGARDGARPSCPTRTSRSASASCSGCPRSAARASWTACSATCAPTRRCSTRCGGRARRASGPG